MGITQYRFHSCFAGLIEVMHVQHAAHEKHSINSNSCCEYPLVEKWNLVQIIQLLKREDGIKGISGGDWPAVHWPGFLASRLAPHTANYNSQPPWQLGTVTWLRCSHCSWQAWFSWPCSFWTESCGNLPKVFVDQWSHRMEGAWVPGSLLGRE